MPLTVHLVTEKIAVCFLKIAKLNMEVEELSDRMYCHIPYISTLKNSGINIQKDLATLPTVVLVSLNIHVLCKGEMMSNLRAQPRYLNPSSYSATFPARHIGLERGVECQAVPNSLFKTALWSLV